MPKYTARRTTKAGTQAVEGHVNELTPSKFHGGTPVKNKPDHPYLQPEYYTSPLKSGVKTSHYPEDQGREVYPPIKR